MRILKTLVLLPLLSACAHPTVWQHDPPSTQRQLNHDMARCNVMASQASAGTDGLMGLAMFMQEKDMCMDGEGWTKVSEH
jgi:hypothetical protein